MLTECFEGDFICSGRAVCISTHQQHILLDFAGFLGRCLFTLYNGSVWGVLSKSFITSKTETIYKAQHIEL